MRSSGKKPCWCSSDNKYTRTELLHKRGKYRNWGIRYKENKQSVTRESKFQSTNTNTHWYAKSHLWFLYVLPLCARKVCVFTLCPIRCVFCFLFSDRTSSSLHFNLLNLSFFFRVLVPYPSMILLFVVLSNSIIGFVLIHVRPHFCCHFVRINRGSDGFMLIGSFIVFPLKIYGLLFHTNLRQRYLLLMLSSFF